MDSALQGHTDQRQQSKGEGSKGTGYGIGHCDIAIRRGQVAPAAIIRRNCEAGRRSKDVILDKKDSGQDGGSGARDPFW